MSGRLKERSARRTSQKATTMSTTRSRKRIDALSHCGKRRAAARIGGEKRGKGRGGRGLNHATLGPERGPLQGGPTPRRGKRQGQSGPPPSSAGARGRR